MLFDLGIAPQLVVERSSAGAGEATIVDANRAADAFYGAAPGALRGRPFASIWGEPSSLDDLLELGASVGVHLADVTHRGVGGEDRPVGVYLSPMPDGAVHVVVHDMAERTRAEARTRERDAERLARQLTQEAVEAWQATFDAMPQPVFLADERGLLTRVNGAAAALLGRPAATVPGRPLDGEGDPGFWAALRAVVHDRGRDVQLRDAAGRTWSASGVAASPDGRVVMVLQELTALLDLQDAVRQRETMARMGELVAGVAHEVRNPLFAISSLLDAARQRLGEHPDFARFGPMLHAQVLRLGDLMRDLLEYGRPTALVRQPTTVRDLASAVDVALQVAGREADVSLAWEWEDEGNHAIVVDRVRFVQLLVNLGANAIQHSPRGGSVRVMVEHQPGALEFRVVDDGAGFPPDVLSRALEPFVTRRPGGTGLGLAIAHRIAEQHGATIHVRNRVAGDGLVGGAVVTVRVPYFPLPAPS